MTGLLYVHRCTQVYLSASYHTPPSVPEAARKKSGAPMIGTASADSRFDNSSPTMRGRSYGIGHSRAEIPMRVRKDGASEVGRYQQFSTECRSSEDVDRRMVGVAELDARPRMSSGVAPRQLQVDGPRSEASGLMTQNVETSVQVNNPVSDLTPSTSGQPTATGTSFITPGIANGPRYFLR